MNDEIFHLTPVDVRRYEFGTQMRGYEKARVDQFREQVADELERMARSNQDLEAKARGFHEQLRAFRERDKALNEALISAQQMRQDTKEQAERECEEEAARTGADHPGVLDWTPTVVHTRHGRIGRGQRMSGPGQDHRGSQHGRGQRDFGEIMARLGIGHRHGPEAEARVLKQASADRDVRLRLGEVATLGVHQGLIAEGRHRHGDRADRFLVGHPGRVDVDRGQRNGRLLGPQRRDTAEENKSSEGTERKGHGVTETG